MWDRKRGCSRSARLYLVLLPFVASSQGCDRGAGDLVRELDAARGGCTEEGLRATSEECVRMFERLADMGSDAIETYVGGLRAFDEALQRRPLDVEVGEVGRAISPSVRGRAEAGYDGGRPAGDVPFDRERATWRPAVGQPGGGSPYYDDRPDVGWDLDGRYPDAWVEEESSVRYRVPARVERGVLLPPSERLRRPWLDDDRDYDRSAPGRTSYPPYYGDPYDERWGVPYDPAWRQPYGPAWEPRYGPMWGPPAPGPYGQPDRYGGTPRNPW
jgi:hypothetical protein